MADFVTLYGERLNRALSSEDTQRLFTTARRKAAINEAQQWFNTQTECLQRTESITLVDSDDQYDLEAEIADDDFQQIASQGPELTIAYASGRTAYYTGDDFPRRTIAWLNQNLKGWRGLADGLPVAWYELKEGGQYIFGLVPAPDITGGDTWTLTVPYVVRPTAMSADADEPFTVGGNALAYLEPYHDALELYAAGLLELLRKDEERSQRLKGLAMQRVLDYKDKHATKPGGQRVQQVYTGWPRRKRFGVSPYEDAV